MSHTYKQPCHLVRITPAWSQRSPTEEIMEKPMAENSFVRHSPRRIANVTASVLGLVALIGFGIPHKALADEVLDWNITGFDATAAGGQNNIVISRTMTM